MPNYLTSAPQTRDSNVITLLTEQGGFVAGIFVLWDMGSGGRNCSIVNMRQAVMVPPELGHM
jgi:hypothetical protein